MAHATKKLPWRTGSKGIQMITRRTTRACHIISTHRRHFTAKIYHVFKGRQETCKDEKIRIQSINTVTIKKPKAIACGRKWYPEYCPEWSSGKKNKVVKRAARLNLQLHQAEPYGLGDGGKNGGRREECEEWARKWVVIIGSRSGRP